MENLLLMLPLIAFVACSLVMIIVWLIQYQIKNAGIVDIFWSYNFLLVTLIYYYFSDGWEPRKILITAMVAIWSFRLGTYLLIRSLGHIEKEDVRYAHFRKEWGEKANFKMFFFFQIQAFSNVLLSLPFLFSLLNPSPAFSTLEYIGTGIWLIGVLGEATADSQLRTFKKNPLNSGKVCQAGLWNYSRHPNYFFEWFIWVGYFIFAVTSPYGWISIICPLSILFLLLKVSGIPMTEELAVKTKGEAYIKYQQSTSAFIPWFKKTGNAV